MGRARQIASSENMDRIILNGTDVTGTTDAGDFLLLDASAAGTDAGFFINTEIGTTETPPAGSIVSSAISNANLEMPNTLDMNGKDLILDADADTSITADTDDQVDIKIGGTDRFSIASTGATTITTAGNESTLSLVSTDADENEGPILKLDRNSSSPANSDKTGFVSFTARNAADESVEISNIETRITDITDGAEACRFILRTIASGSLNSRMDINETETVFNEGANDLDFRIESDTLSNIFKVDGGNNSVRIGSNGVPDSNTTRCIINGNSSNRPLDIDRSTTTATADVVKVFTNVGGTDTNVATIEANGDFLSATNSYGSLSDERFKQDIVDSGSQWDDVKAMRIRKYRRKNMVATEGDNAPVEIGVIAQELESSDMGGLVKTNPKDDENKEEFKTVKYTVLYMKAIKALQEAMARIETLETEVAKLKG